MALTFEKDVNVKKQVGVGADGDFVFSWATGPGAKRVRVQAYRKFIEDHWRVDSWTNEELVKAAFRKHRDEYLDAASAAPDSGGEFRVFVIG